LAHDGGIIHDEDIQDTGVTGSVGGESICEIAMLVGAHVFSYS